MMNRTLIPAALSAALMFLTFGSAQAFDDSEYPNFKGQWRRIPIPGVGGQISFDQHRAWGWGQGAPLTPEYQKRYVQMLYHEGVDNSKQWNASFCYPEGFTHW